MSASGLGLSASPSAPAVHKLADNQSHWYKSICYTLLQRCVNFSCLFYKHIQAIAQQQREKAMKETCTLILERKIARGLQTQEILLNNKVAQICALLFSSINEKRSIEDNRKKTIEVNLVENQKSCSNLSSDLQSTV